MTGHRLFDELRNGVSAERRACNLEEMHDMLHEMVHHEMRNALIKTQVELEITARFPDAFVTITNFGEHGKLSGQSRKCGKTSPLAIS